MLAPSILALVRWIAGRFYFCLSTILLQSDAMHPPMNSKQLLLTVAVLLLSMPGFAAEPKIADFPLRGEVSTASRTRSDGNTWTTFKIDRSSYVVTGGDFGVDIYAVRIKGMTLEVLSKGDNGKLHVSKCPITVIVNLKTGEIVHLSSDAPRAVRVYPRPQLGTPPIFTC